MSTNPAKTFGLPNKGTLEVGTDADIIVFNPDVTFKITSDDNVSNADYSIYEGRTVSGKVTKTFVRGQLVADDGEVAGLPGYGNFVSRELPRWKP